MTAPQTCRGRTAQRRQATAEIRILLARDSIQQALRLIEKAAQALSRVDGMIPERRKVGSLSNQLGQAWFAVSAGANRLRRKRLPRAD